MAALEHWPADGDPGQPGRLADGHRQAPGDRRAAPPQAARPQARGDRARAGRSSSEHAADEIEAALDDDVGDDLLRLIFTSCHPVLSTEARVALTLAPAGRPDHRRDRPRLPGPRADGRAAHRARQADAGRGQGPVRGAARRRAGRAAGLGAGGHLPHLQRGLLGDRRRRLDAAGAVRGRAAPGPDPGRAGAGGARGARPGGADGDPGLADRRPHRTRRRSRSCCSIRTGRAGTSC